MLSQRGWQQRSSVSMDYLDFDLCHVGDQIEEEDDDMDNDVEYLIQDENVDDFDLTLYELLQC